MIAGPPTTEPDVPRAVAALAAGRPCRPVWLNAVGGLTFELRGDGTRWFVKWAPSHSGLDLGREAQRLRWASAYTPVPRVLDEGGDDEGTWLLTEGLPGESAVAARWKDQPAIAVRAIGEGLRAFHDALPVPACPFSWTADERVDDARRRAAEGKVRAADWHAEHRSLTVDAALARVAEAPPVDALVVCHGDTCAPNTLLTDDGRWSGHVDLGSLGVADRWADLAIATWSTEWNYGPGWESVLLGAYGVDPDPERTAYYRLLWDLGP